MALAAVTGTEGKTTVVETLRHLAEAAGTPAVSVGTLGVLDGASRRPLPRCTPSPRLAEALREIEAERTDRVVAVDEAREVVPLANAIEEVVGSFHASRATSRVMMTRPVTLVGVRPCDGSARCRLP